MTALPEALKQVRADAQAMWDSFDTLMDDETDTLLEPFYHWPAGTETTVIWLWFDEHSPSGVYTLMFPPETV